MKKTDFDKIWQTRINITHHFKKQNENLGPSVWQSYTTTDWLHTYTDTLNLKHSSFHQGLKNNLHDVFLVKVLSHSSHSEGNFNE